MTTFTLPDSRHGEDCDNPTCTHPDHLPDRDDTTWGAADEAAWLWDDDVQRRRADR